MPLFPISADEFQEPPAQPSPHKNTRAQQSRINGAKSQGPITPEGKLTCSRGALKHGLTAEKHAILDIENPAEFKAVLDAAIAEFRPSSLFTTRLVEKLAHVDWRTERLAMLETAYLNHKVNEAAGLPVPAQDPLTQAAEKGSDETAALLRGWLSASEGNVLELLRRYLGTLENQYNRTLSNILKMEKRSHARRLDRDLDPAFQPPYVKPEYPPEEVNEAPQATPEPRQQAPSPVKIESPKVVVITEAAQSKPQTKQTRDPRALHGVTPPNDLDPATKPMK